MSEILNLEKVSQLIKPILKGMNLRFYDLSFNEVSKVLRLYIDKKGGDVTIGECKKVSNQVSKVLDEAELINFPYTLEVSSPGIERPLKTRQHFQWAIGKTAEILLENKKIRGYVRRVTDDGVYIATNGQEEFIYFNLIIKAKLVEELVYGKRR
ncbi:hypothetical protein BXT86_00260 [candidate division WOR-3 bacterium 4484_100]|uniref:Ribosome maturation factor RimP n=1 Tax=candidate division WOR-3 bacterium 4484_100 TaxID=1936077 RepID=A0A1V4QGZ4_UNCW3|nr:MAG: hypothetical protein BXT86_00260 [candidate division WOR-3 bacterium 4484_100]